MYLHNYIHEFADYRSLEPSNPVAPNWNMPLFHSYIDTPEEFNRDLREYAETIPNPDFFKKDDIKLEFDGWSTEETNRIPEYNFLDTDNFAVQEFKQFIRSSHDTYLKALDIELPEEMRKRLKIQCWVNILPKGQAIKPHNHYCGPNSWISGNYSVTADADTYTAYYAPSHEIRLQNKPGMLILFPSWVGHYASEYQGDDKRITVAFDLYFDSLNQWSGNYDALKESYFYA